MLEEQRKDHWFIDLLGALVCGYLVGCLQDIRAHSGTEMVYPNFIRVVRLAILSYSSAAILLTLWRSRPFRKLPNWVLIIALGSVLYYFCIHLEDTITYAWKFRDTQPELNIVEYVLSYAWQFSSGLIFISLTDSLLMLPVMGVIHYLGNVIVNGIGSLRAPAA